MPGRITGAGVTGGLRTPPASENTLLLTTDWSRGTFAPFIPDQAGEGVAVPFKCALKRQSGDGAGGLEAYWWVWVAIIPDEAGPDAEEFPEAVLEGDRPLSCTQGEYSKGATAPLSAAETGMGPGIMCLQRAAGGAAPYSRMRGGAPPRLWKALHAESGPSSSGMAPFPSTSAYTSGPIPPPQRSYIIFPLPSMVHRIPTAVPECIINRAVHDVTISV